MNIIRKINADEAKIAIQEISASLPEWFGIPEANTRYAKGVQDRLSFGYFSENDCLGMITLEFPFDRNANIYWMGVAKKARGQGIGKALLQKAEHFCLEQNIFSLTVETLSPKENDPNYRKTFNFYLKAGFNPLFELNTYSPDYLMVYLNKLLSPKIFTWIDLTHSISSKTPTWDGSCGFTKSGKRCGEFLAEQLEMCAGIGTHIDAPFHCFSNGLTVDKIPVSALISPCAVIDVSKETSADYSVNLNIIESFEKKHGPLPKNTFVIFYTGWEKFWGEPKKYRNKGLFPSISQEVAEYLIAKEIAGIGIDTLSPDRADSAFPVHKILLGSGKYIVENVKNANQMPPMGGFSFLMPLKIENGSEAPLRLFGVVL